MIRFKDLRVVDMRDGEPDEVQHQAHRTKRTSVDEGPDEALNIQQRLARGRSMKRNKAKLKMGRNRAARRTANKDVLKKRARKAARNIILKKLTKDIPKSDMSVARKMELEKRLEKMGSRIDRIAVKLLPKMRQAEKDRKQHKAQSKNG